MRELSRGKTALIGFDAAQVADAIERHGVDFVVSSPGNALALLRSAKASGHGAIPPIKALMLGGAAVTPAQQKIIRARLCDNLWINYGATEVGVVALLDPELGSTHPDCAGRLVPWLDAHVTDAGLLRLRSPMMASGYVLGPDAPEWDRHAFDGGWFQSRDRARIEDDRRVYLAAREDDVFNVGGNKVDPQSIEKVIAQWSGILECAVIPIAADDGSQRLTAFVVSNDALDRPALKAHCRERLDAWKVPKYFVRVGELPRNEGGKIMRRQLAERFKIGNRSGATEVMDT
jgi:acyl-coenzyme A synthetase/AMP-(fatty) acid ligase